MKSMTMRVLKGIFASLREKRLLLIGISFFLLLSACTASQKELFVSENFVLIRGGEFTMGSPDYEVDRKYDEIQHQVKVSDFYISKYEVTGAEFKRYIKATPPKFVEVTIEVSHKIPAGSVQEGFYTKQYYTEYFELETRLRPAFEMIGQLRV